MTKDSRNNEYVILLHGMTRTSRSMRKLANALDESGYQVLNINYPSTQFPIEHLAETVISEALLRVPQGCCIHFVTHSLGGILVRQYLSKNSLESLGRVVMIGPPNQGSQLVDKLGWIPLFKMLNGPSGLQLGTKCNSVPIELGAADFEVGIIAGTRSVNWFLSLLIPGPNDGKVSVENTKLDGMSDHIALSATHPFMTDNREVIVQVGHFLSSGRFVRSSDK